MKIHKDDNVLVVTGKDRKHRHWLTPVDMKKAAPGAKAKGKKK